MPFVPFPDGVVGIQITCNLDGLPAEITLGAKFFTGAALFSDGVALCTLIHTWLTADMVPLVTPNVTWRDIIVTDLTSASGWEATEAVGEIGTGAGTPVQSQVAMVVTFETAKRGRSYRGRNYIPGLPTANLFDSKSWSNAAALGAAGRYDDLDTALVAGGWTPVVLSRFAGGVERVLGVATPIVNNRGNTKLGTIRGRLS